tara:strand:- start:158 stop:1036 length:879 start_codon:yes stop_codon:yes gene_type:complete
MSVPVLQVQLDVIAQELTYMGTIKPIPENYWKDTLSLLLYPDWDSEKDKLITFSYYSDSNTYIAARRKYVRNFKTNKDEWKDYEMEAVDNAKALTLKDKLIEGFYLIDSIENTNFEVELAQMYAKQATVTPLSVRLARNFLLDETDWVMCSDCPLSADDKALYTTYRTKLRDLTGTPEFSGNAEGTKFPITPEFYNKIYKIENPSNAYLATDDQFLPLSGHYLKVFKEKIAHFLLLKSVTQTNYFSQIITQYQMSKPVVYDDPKMDPMNNEAYDKAEFLNLLIQEAQKELGS